MAQALADIIRELEGVYAPQKQLVAQQTEALTPYYTAQQQGLEAAKGNEFRNITSRANSRGLLYSGMPIQEEARYVGEKFLPAVAGLKEQESERRFALQDVLNKIAQAQSEQAYGIRGKQVEADVAAAAAEAKRQQDERQFQQQLALSRSKSSGGSTATSYKASQDARKAEAIQAVQGALSYAQANPNAVKPYYREGVYQNVLAAYGDVISAKDLQNVVYQQYFPSNWEKRNGIPWGR